jgi:general secretion pathway protein I
MTASSASTPLVPAKAGNQSSARTPRRARCWIPACAGMSGRKSTHGFTLIEVLVALAVVSVSLAAIGSLIAVTTRGVRSIGLHLTLVETARAIVTGLPGRDQLAPGNFSGEAAGHRWRVDVLPFYANFVDPQATTWTPETVVVRVQSPSGPILQVNTVKLRRRSAE